MLVFLLQVLLPGVTLVASGGARLKNGRHLSDAPSSGLCANTWTCSLSRVQRKDCRPSASSRLHDRRRLHDGRARFSTAFDGVSNPRIETPVEATNLNRLVGATAEDARSARLKVDVVERMALSVDPLIEVIKIPNSVTSDAAVNALQTVDHIVGCLDHDGPRLLLTVLSSTYDKPYLDLATDISVDDAWFGGRVIFASGGEGCLV